MNDSQRPSESVQLSLAGLILAVTIVGALLSILVPHLRESSDLVRWHILLMLTNAMLVGALTVWRVGHHWRRILSQAGARVVDIRTSQDHDQATSTRHFLISGCIALAVLSPFIFIAQIDLSLGEFGRVDDIPYWVFLFGHLQTAFVAWLMARWWSRSQLLRGLSANLDIRENGLIHGAWHYHPWSSISEYDLRDGETQWLIITRADNGTLVSPVSEDTTAELREFLDSRGIPQVTLES